LHEDGELSVVEAKVVIDKLLDLARPEERAGLEKLLAQNRVTLEKYLTS